MANTPKRQVIRAKCGIIGYAFSVFAKAISYTTIARSFRALPRGCGVISGFGGVAAGGRSENTLSRDLRADYDGGTGMNKIILDYQKWKQQGDDLRIQAKQAMESRFRELLVEAVQIAEEYRADFGAPLKPPPGVTSFRYKAGARPKPKKDRKPNAA